MANNEELPPWKRGNTFKILGSTAVRSRNLENKVSSVLPMRLHCEEGNCSGSSLERVNADATVLVEYRHSIIIRKGSGDPSLSTEMDLLKCFTVVSWDS